MLSQILQTSQGQAAPNFEQLSASCSNAATAILDIARTNSLERLNNPQALQTILIPCVCGRLEARQAAMRIIEVLSRRHLISTYFKATDTINKNPTESYKDCTDRYAENAERYQSIQPRLNQQNDVARPTSSEATSNREQIVTNVGLSLIIKKQNLFHNQNDEPIEHRVSSNQESVNRVESPRVETPDVGLVPPAAKGREIRRRPSPKLWVPLTLVGTALLGSAIGLTLGLVPRPYAEFRPVP